MISGMLLSIAAGERDDKGMKKGQLFLVPCSLFGEIRHRSGGKYFQVSGLGRQVPGSGAQHRVQVRGRTCTRT